MTPSQKEGCENATYWREQFPNQNVFVSYYKSLCTFDLDRDVTLKSNPNATVTLHSSCDQKDIDSTLSGRMAVPNLPQDDGNSKTNLIIFICSGGVGVLILIAIVNVAVIRKMKKDIVVVDENAIYGRHDPNVYYEDGVNSQVEDKNAYYE